MAEHTPETRERLKRHAWEESVPRLIRHARAKCAPVEVTPAVTAGARAGLYAAAPVKAGPGWTRHRVEFPALRWTPAGGPAVALAAERIGPVVNLQFLLNETGRKDSGTLSISGIRLE